MTPARKPWWQLTHTPRQGYILGGFWLSMAIFQALIVIGKPMDWRVALAAGFGLLGVGYLVSAVRLRRAPTCADDVPVGARWRRRR
ncbi:hypothetical protein GA0070616_0272 [Micromonospora nigra]|uniref:Uncharacterized protein n=1 Tax=Micromonospora nigra TaxID=145857 RepID=A0A1C6RA60_9ACTN|nr:hypothetical protein [Micromonospora nigra]SCL13908.1 hypothetical protein GA0070616_0272 [Micromonospora nigra]